MKLRDSTNDAPKFLILKPPKCGDTAQRAMAAHFHRSELGALREIPVSDVGLYSEIFTSVCSEVSPKGDDVTGAARIYRVVNGEGENEEAKAYANRLWGLLGNLSVNIPCVKIVLPYNMVKKFFFCQTEIDSGQYDLAWDEAKQEVSIKQKDKAEGI